MEKLSPHYSISALKVYVAEIETKDFYQIYN